MRTEGADEWFARFWAQHHQPVLAYALRRTNPGMADDVVAETFLIAWRRRHELPGQPRAWLIGVARNVLANQARGQRRQVALVDVMVRQAAQSTGSSESVDVELFEVLDGLAESDRELLLLASWDGLSAGEIGAVLGCSTSAVWVRMHRARQRLRRRLEEADAQPANIEVDLA